MLYEVITRPVLASTVAIAVLLEVQTTLCTEAFAGRMVRNNFV